MIKKKVDYNATMFHTRIIVKSIGGIYILNYIALPIFKYVLITKINKLLETQNEACVRDVADHKTCIMALILPFILFNILPFVLGTLILFYTTYKLLYVVCMFACIFTSIDLIRTVNIKDEMERILYTVL